MRFKNLAWVLIAAVLAVTPSVAQQSGAEAWSGVGTPRNARLQASYGNLPLRFEANQGQTSAQVRFLSRGKGYTAFLTAGGMVLSVHPSQPVPATSDVTATQKSRPRTNTTLQFKLLGAAQNPVVVGEDPQPGRVNYFIGRDPSQWHTNVPTYARVRYKNVYPGIDLVYYGNHRQLEYDFAIAPGADARRVQFEITGANQIDLDADGNLVLQTASGEMHFQSPVVYQELNGQRVPVAGSYVMNDATHVGFSVAGYDTTKPLVIDPVLVYSTYLGGSGDDQPSGIAVDSTGSVYVAGYTDSTDFPLATLGSLPAGSTHIFVAKLDPTGSTLVYADYIGGNNQDYGYALALDSSNDVYVTGSTASSDFPLVNPYQGTYPGSFNAFLTKVSPDGSSLLYSTYLGGNGSDQPSSIAVDAAGEMVVAGNTTSTNFPMANAYQGTVSANQGGVWGNYGFVTKFTASGSSLVYSTYLGGSSNVAYDCGTPCWPSPYSAVAGVAVDGSGNAYAAGFTNTYDFPTTSSAYQTTNTVQEDGTVSFVSKLSSSGSADYSTYFYESSGNLTSIAAVAVDGSGSAYVTGAAYSDGTFPITSTSICDPGVEGSACSYAFVTKFDPTGSTLTYSTFLGANNNANPQAIVLDANNDAYVLSSVASSGFNIVNGLEAYSNGNDLLLVEIDPVASTELFATYLGASVDEFPSGVAVDASGNMYVAGSTDSPDLPVTQGAFQNALTGSPNAFLLKIGPSAAPAAAMSPNALQFAAQALGSTSAAQAVLLRNMGSAALSITSITPSGDFAETNTCGTSVPAAGSCTLSVTFTPTASGTRSGSIVIQDDAAGSPHAITLSGVGSSPAASLAPASLSFAATLVGGSSAAQTVTLTNTGTVALSISNKQINGDYSQTNNCPASLAAGSNCKFNVTFSPTASGTRSGSLVLTDNAASSPQTVTLTGSGYVNTATVAPSSLTFSSQALNTTSAAQVVTVTNTGTGSITISGVAVSGDFGQTNTCTTIAANGGTCSISVKFTPTASGVRSGTLTVSGNFTGSPQAVSLSGTGLASSTGNAITVAPSSLSFASQVLNTPSTAQVVTVTNTGTGSVTISSVVASGDFGQTNTCSTVAANGGTCNVSVKFTPSASGVRSGTLTISGNFTGSTQTVSLSGAGADFSVVSAPNSSSVQPGATATYTLTVASVGGSFASAVQLACSGAPKLTTCSVSPTSVTPGATSATATLTVTTTGASAMMMSPASSQSHPMYAALFQLQGLGVFGIMLAGSRKRSRKVRVMFLLALVIAASMFMIACAGGTGVGQQQQQTGTAPGTYTITVTGTSGSLQHSIPVTLIVQ
jgi:beta-propeller repeat-containing protein/centrosomal CEP192-like protein/HYDIN/CFA65/VesB family protein